MQTMRYHVDMDGSGAACHTRSRLVENYASFKITSTGVRGSAVVCCKKCLKIATPSH